MSSDNTIYGLWENTVEINGEPKGKLKLLFLPGNKFAYFEQNLSEFPNGLEIGSFDLSKNKITYELDFDGIRTFGSDGGLSESISYINLVTVNTNNLVLGLGNYGDFGFSRVETESPSMNCKAFGY